MKWILIVIGILMVCPDLRSQDTITNVQEPVPEELVEPVAPTEVVTAEEVPPAQPQKPAQKAAWKKKLYFGGYVNFSLGSYTSIGIEPMVGYKIIPILSVGAKIRYDYIKDNRYSSSYSTSNYGGSLFSRLKLGKRIYLHAEYAGYNYELFNEQGGSGREWIPFFFVGGGLRQPMGKRASLNVQVLFDVLNHADSPYRQWEPFYSVGMSVGF